MEFYLDRQTTILISLAVGYAHNLGLSRIPRVFLGCKRLDEEIR